MIGDTAFNDACREWRRVARAQRQAIRSRNWALMTECHRALEQLQPRLSDFTARARSEWSQLGTAGEDKEKALQGILGELLETARSNESLLQSIHDSARTEFRTVQEAGRNLQRLRRSYSGGRLSEWTSVS